MFYKPSEEDIEDSIKESKYQRYMDVNDAEMLEKLFNIKFINFIESCEAINNQFTQQSTLDINNIDCLSHFFIEIHDAIIENQFTLKTFTKVLLDNEIDKAIYYILSTSANVSEIESAVFFLAVITAYSLDSFGQFIPQNRYFPLIFNIFCNTNIVTQGNFNQNITACLLNLVKDEERYNDSFGPFNDDFESSFENFNKMIEFRCAEGGPSYLFRIFIPIYNKFFQNFTIEHIQILYNVYLEDRLVFTYSARLAIKIIQNNKTEPQILTILFDYFSDFWNQLPRYDEEAWDCGLELYSQLLTYLPNELKLSLLNNVTIFPYLIEKGIRNKYLASNILDFMTNLINMFIPSGGNNPNSQEIWAFQFILTALQGSTDRIISPINDMFEHLSAEGKLSALNFFNVFSSKSHEAAQNIVRIIDIDILTEFLDSGSNKEISVSLDLILRLLFTARQIGERAAVDFVEYLEMHDIHEYMRDLQENDDERIQYMAQRVIDTVYDIVGEEEDDEQ
ncbi:hypothetical protein TVAG_044520 [Trichomonas vaginalis G3]|uniref:Uncharacterized protein n=1 Tax=Trichomonas vaginalis (strain ATCC PRA-98 / G3) TaxID=412133 RepID=A2EY24_TRIV3|nr:armadillo (ARM) repeat-containing protein family [Trichomonas vaginalis G3]EAY02434.1 hypothetical protein TVAG_044520 [Trichomonas vaginalis G3]KAI5527872.1 armadillo (ARM) repeat-containing protein family [Trichomonas vaginalis G3]|eukprot:XP_001314692.1 hypothetical protein [Trichomonas vaginalis G3]